VAIQNFRCDRNRLRSLLDQHLPAEQEAEVVGHLDGCQECQNALERLAADGGWWNELRRIKALEDEDETSPAPLSPALSDAESTQLEASANALGEDIPLDFLDPPRDSTHLGRLSSFFVTAVLGRGGAGIVLQGSDPALNRIVAIKILAPHLARNGAARRRFDREAQAAAAVVHEHVVAIHAVDVWKGLPYLVMSYVGGRSLQDRIDRDGPFEIKEILRIGMQACSGLAAAHAQGLVHRDVKPANILLENGVQRVRLTDFGLARAVDDASLTQSGVVAGTPQYMAPEQARGEVIDHRADLFSLGSTLYAMCTGQPPFRAESAMAVLRRVSDDQPRPVRSLNPDIPVWLAALIERLHAKDPDDRFQSANEVRDLLSQCLAHVQQPDAISVPEILRAGPVEKKHPRRVGRGLTAAGIVLCLGLALLAGVWGTPLGRYFGLFQHPDDASTEGNNEQKTVGAPVKEIDQVQQQLDEVREGTAALEADLKRPSATGMGDPTERLLQETRQTIQRLERELGGTSPE
jgi:eukaryotic-like serine/threonine-protein kinase